MKYNMYFSWNSDYSETEVIGSFQPFSKWFLLVLQDSVDFLKLKFKGLVLKSIKPFFLSMKYLTILLLVLNLFVAYPDDDKDDGGKLDDIEKPKKSDDGGGSTPQNNNDQEDMSFGEWLAYQLLVELIYQAAFHSPQFFFGNATANRYTNYPYHGFTDGFYDSMSDKEYAGNFQFSMARESQNLHSINLFSSVYLGKYVSIDGSVSNYFESIDGINNSLLISDFYLNMNRIRKENFVFRYGLGVKSIFGERSRSGFSYKFGMDIYPLDPISFSAYYNGSFIDFVYYNELNLQVNYYLERFYFYLGFDHFSTDRTLNNQVTINQIKLGSGISF